MSTPEIIALFLFGVGLGVVFGYAKARNWNEA